MANKTQNTEQSQAVTSTLTIENDLKDTIFIETQSYEKVIVQNCPNLVLIHIKVLGSRTTQAQNNQPPKLILKNLPKLEWVVSAKKNPAISLQHEANEIPQPFEFKGALAEAKVRWGALKIILNTMQSPSDNWEIERLNLAVHYCAIQDF